MKSMFLRLNSACRWGRLFFFTAQAWIVTAHAANPSEADWPSFRGPQAKGTAGSGQTPERWNAERSENIRWKTPIPGLGHSSPVIWGDKIFVTTAINESGSEPLKVGLYGNIDPVIEQTKQRWLLLCLDKTNGKVLWQSAGPEGIPRVKRHPKSTHANSTPATDGRHVACLFGSEGLFCFSTTGKPVWKKDLGPLDSGYFLVPSAQWGFASSPVIHGNLVMVQCDVQTNSFLAAFRLSDGQEVWKTPRADVPTWSTPTVETGGGRTQIIVNGYRYIGGYDLATGQEIWRLKGGGDIPVPTPVVAHDLIFITNAHGKMAPIYAVKIDSVGDISLADNQSANQHIAWSLSRRGNYMQTPIVVREFLYCCNDAGVLACYDARTGQNLYTERLGTGGSGFTASAVAADGKIYFTSELGTVYVVKAGPKFEVLAKNEMGETCMATPAISEGALFFRTRHHVVAIAASKSTRLP
ncbi:MAG: PQQ-binding-like beta-propeller repeat protein [Verrucomicrobia bacterium]|nr:PQQ-binding-like beta-propeller repeat protein [Verrucomicrobiota bacterium]